MTISCFQQFFIMRRKFLFALSIVNNAFGLNMAINKTSSCDDRPSISTGSQPTANPFLCSDKAMESRRRPRRYHVDRRSGRREVAPELYTLHPTLPYYSLFSKPSERDRDFNGVCFATHKRPNCVFWSDAWPAPATYHRPPREHCRSRLGRIPKQARHVQIPWRSHQFRRFEVCRSLRISPLRVQHSGWAVNGIYRRKNPPGKPFC